MRPSSANTYTDPAANPEAALPPVDFHNVARGSGGIALAHETDTDTSVFETAKQYEHNIPDEIIPRILNNNFMVGRKADGSPSKVDAYHLKVYLDQVEADPADHELAMDAEKISGLYNQTADLIIDKLQLYRAPASPHATQQEKARRIQMGTYLAGAKAKYLQKVESDKAIVKDFATDVTTVFASGVTPQRNKIPRAPASALEFQGLTIQANGKNGPKNVNLMKGASHGIRPNMRVQETGGKKFVHWSSHEYMQKRVAGDKTDFKHRIYLNPKAESTVAVFRDVIEAADAQGLNVRGKFFDRASDATANTAQAFRGNDFMTRADGIVLYAADDADKLMAIVDQVYAKHQPAFRGRGMSVIPFQLKEGLAIGDEPLDGDSETSLTGSRINAMWAAKDATFADLGLTGGAEVPPALEAKAVALFKKHFAEVADERGIDQHNIAFNAEPGTNTKTHGKPNQAQKPDMQAQPKPPAKEATPANANHEETLTASELQQKAIDFFQKGLNGEFSGVQGTSPGQEMRLKKALALVERGDPRTLEDYARLRRTIQNIRQQNAGKPIREIKDEIIRRSIDAVSKTNAALHAETDPDERKRLVRSQLSANMVLDAYNANSPVTEISDRALRQRIMAL